MNYVVLFFSGAFLCNALPHLAAGLRGECFPSPFATPRGKGPSSPLVNFLWGFLNAIIGVSLLVSHPFALGVNVESAAVALGALLPGVFTSIHFGRARRDGLF
jgi:hypothetical protein